jgi:hypothetical protein
VRDGNTLRYAEEADDLPILDIIRPRIEGGVRGAKITRRGGKVSRQAYRTEAARIMPLFYVGI